jgi:branched-chain amino acid transport system substrate-binding protein
MRRRSIGAALLGLIAATAFALPAQAADPIRIGLGMAQTGPLAANGKSALLAMEIWREDINAKGGLLGRPVEFVVYDDQSNPSTVPGMHTKLLDVDKVDLIVSGYGTNVIAPAMPVIIQHNRTFLSLFGLAVNGNFHYPKYFTITPTGPDPAVSSTIGFFEVGEMQNPKPKTLAIVAADAEYPRTSAEGVKKNAQKFGWKVVYDRNYPPNTTDFSPIVRAVQATNPDAVFVASYPLDSVGMVRAASERQGATALIVGAAPPSHISPVVLPGLHHGSAIETRGIPAAWRARDHPAWCGLATYAAKQGVQFCRPGHFSPYS